MIEKVISNRSSNTHYWVAGSGDACIVFLHGATADHQLFQHQFEFFGNNFQIIALDVPAHGKSRPYPDFNLKLAADEVVRILDAEGVRQAHLIGQSMGGDIAQLVAQYAPERVRSLISIGSSPIQPPYYSALDKFFLKITPAILRASPYRMLIKSIANQVSTTSEGKQYMLETLETYTKSEIVTIMREVYVGVQAYQTNHPLELHI